MWQARFLGVVRISSLFLASAIVLGVAGCGKASDGIVIPAQHWKDADIRIETHPNPPIAGMSEIVVIVTGVRGRPVYNLIVSLRSDDTMPWVQAIQDGQIGVYRRAVDVKATNGDEAVLQVRLQQGEEQKSLLFPLKLQMN